MTPVICMDEYFAVMLKEDGKNTTTLEKVVPGEYRNRTYKDLLGFMVEHNDKEGNVLAEAEKTLAQRITSWLNAASADPNSILVVRANVNGQSHVSKYTDMIPHQAYVKQTTQDKDGNPLQYDTLDLYVNRVEVGG